MRALQMYAVLRDELDPSDEERLLWICDQVAPTPPPELTPVIEDAAEKGSPIVRRAAMNALAIAAFYAGDRPTAERLWTRGLREPHLTRDRYWIRSCLNLAMALFERRCVFEPLALTAVGKRAAIDAGLPYLRSYATVRHAHILILVGDLERARAELDEADAANVQIHEEGQRRVVLHEAMTARALLYEAAGDPEAAYDERARQLAWLEEYRHVENPVLAEVHMAKLELHFDLAVDERIDVLCEFEEIPDRYALDMSWRETWQRQFLGLRIRDAVARGASESALDYARRLLDLLRTGTHDSRTAARASALGRLLTNELKVPALARAAFELGSEACVGRIVEAYRASLEIPELSEATADNWSTLLRYRKRLLEQQRELLEAVAEHLKPGEPAYDLLARNDLISVCAWCGRARTHDRTWLPVSHLLPPDKAFRVSHGICEVCRDEHFPRRRGSG
ncbi:MAG: hypothetical protein ACYTGN_13020 [Planctomycetota bacterium]